MATTQVQLFLAMQTGEITVTSGSIHLLRVTTQPEPAPGVTFNIKDISTFPDTYIDSVILDSEGNGNLQISFENTGDSTRTIELQALQDWSLWIASNIILVHILPATTPTCLVEGDLNLPYGLECCPGLESTLLNPYCHNLPLRVTEVKITSMSGVKYSTSNPAPVNTDVYIFISTNKTDDGLIILKDNGTTIYSTTLLKGYTLSGQRYKFTQPGVHNICATAPGNDICVTIPVSVAPTCQPPNAVQRYCVDATTTAVWNQVDCRYDTAPCGAGKHCANGYCVADSGCVPVWRCESPANGYENDGCGNRRLNVACNQIQPPTPPPTPLPTEDNQIYTEIAIVIAAGLAAVLILKKEK